MSLYEFQPEDANRFSREQGIQTRVRGNELQFKVCPYCFGGQHKDAYTFSINLKTGLHNCQRSSCGVRGNMIKLSRDFNFSLGTDVDEYYEQRRRFKNIHRKARPITKPAAVAYMESRGISEAVCKEYNITTQKEHDNILVFPFYDENDILQFAKYRKTDFDKSKDKNKEWCEASCKPILFGMNHTDPENKTLVMTEGQIDSLSCAEAGVKNAVSVPTGAKGFTWVPYCWDFLSRFDTLIVFGDHEHDHITLLDEMNKRFHGTVKHVREQDYLGCKDANEILMKHGAKAVADAVQNAIPVENPRIRKLSEVERVDITQRPKITTGFSRLDAILGGFFFGQLVILTGERGEGKSTLASQFGTMAMAADCPVMFYSGELEDWYFREWIDRQVAGNKNIKESVSSFNFTNYSVNESCIPAIEAWYDERAYLYDGSIVKDGEAEDETILKTMEAAIKQYGCRMLVIDNLMTAMDDDISADIYRQQSNFVKALAKMAKDFDVLVLLIVHPRKTNGDLRNNDVAGSSNITNLADIVLSYSRQSADDDTARVLRVMKNRLTGTLTKNGIEMFFQPSSKRISEKHNDFDWKLGWEALDEDEFMPVPEQEELPF